MPARGHAKDAARKEALALTLECLALALVAECIALARQCKRGKPCGGTCIPQGRTCRLGNDRNPALTSLFRTGHATVLRIINDRAAMQDLFGRQLTDRELSRLAGAPSNGHVNVSGGYTGDHLTLSVGGEHIDTQMRTVYRDAAGTLTVNNDYFITAGETGPLDVGQSPAPQGYGTRSFAAQVAAARKLGIARIQTFAARDDATGYVGYKVWPRLGYDGKLPTVTKRRLPRALKGAKTIQDLYRTPEGREFWEQKGVGCKMSFDPSKGSRSIRVLKKNLRDRNIQMRL